MHFKFHEDSYRAAELVISDVSVRLQKLILNFNFSQTVGRKVYRLIWELVSCSDGWFSLEDLVNLMI